MKKKYGIQNETGVTTQHPDYKAEITDILRSNLTPGIKQTRLLAYHARDLASALEILTPEERDSLYRILKPETLADIFEYAGDEMKYLKEMSLSRQISVLSRFEADEMAGYIRGMDKEDRMAVIDLLEDDLKKQVLLLHSFRDDEIGSRMTTNYIAVPAGISVRQAMRQLIRQAENNDNVSTIYVLDEKQMFRGAIDLKDLIVAREGTDLDTITVTSYPYVYAEEPIDECLSRIRDYSEDSIPVLDRDNRLIGVLTSQDMVELVDDQLGDDYAKLAGLSSEEDLRESLGKSIRKRLPWLVVLLALGMAVSSVVGAFEGVVSRLPLIIAFQSLILDMAGNVGTQSLAVTIRVLMDEKISRRQLVSLVAKEGRVGLVNGLILGSLSFAIIGLYLWLLKSQSLFLAFSISACTGIALLLAMTLSSLSGTLIPVIFKKLGVDPAVASGPLITTVNDLVAVVTYYGLAWLLILSVLHV